MIYVLEDEDNIRELISYSLTKMGYEVRGFGLPSELFSALCDAVPSLLILDIMLPEQDGLSVLRKLRATDKTARLPVIMLTAKSSELDKVTALDLGADDYVTKPFGVLELSARVNAILRRTSQSVGGNTYTAGCVSVSVKEHTVLVSGVPVELTNKEFSLLTYLFEHRGEVLDRDTILSQIWGYSFGGESRTVDVHIRTLRQKLGEGGDIIETVRGVGYKISAKDESV
ncbi:MAG: response regulator transcription factor [Clostridia bacterium]|nr:response regulator transcription factor [Clostridia bacterium]